MAGEPGERGKRELQDDERSLERVCRILDSGGPRSPPEARRVENRVIGADANPYVATAVTLACGLLGMRERLEPTAESVGSANDSQYELPRTMSEALLLLENTPALAQVLGERFVTTYRLAKELEYDEFMQVISSWEREHLLLHG